jgi:hypothetical protein
MGRKQPRMGRDTRAAEMLDPWVGRDAVASPHLCCGPYRNCSRIFPVEVTTYASLDKIKAAVAPLIERELPAGEEEPAFTVGLLVHPPSLLTLCRVRHWLWGKLAQVSLVCTDLRRADLLSVFLW